MVYSYSDSERLFQATVAAEGTTTGPGAAAGNSIVDAGLAGVGDNSFFSMLAVVYPGQPRLVDSMDITGFDNATGEVTLSTAYKGVAAPIPAGVPYKIVTFRFVPAEVAAIDAKLGAFTVAENLKAILGNLATTKRLGQILGALDETNTLKAIIGAYTAAANLKAAIDTIDTVVDAIKAVTDLLPNGGALTALLASIASILTDTGTTIPGLLATIAGYIDTEIAAIKTQTDKIGDATIGLANLKALIDTLTGYVDTEVAAIKAKTDLIPADITAQLDTNIPAIKTQTDKIGDATIGLANLKALIDTLTGYVDTEVAAILADTDPKVMGRLQIKATTVDLAQAGGTVVDLFIATTQDVIVEKLVIRMSGGTLVGSNLTSILIQTDDATPIVLIDIVAGAVANLTNEAQLTWTGAILLDAGTSAKIQVTLNGGAATAAKVCDVIAEYRAVVAGGLLT